MKLVAMAPAKRQRYKLTRSWAANRGKVARGKTAAVCFLWLAAVESH